jgi:hypothetical protein
VKSRGLIAQVRKKINAETILVGNPLLRRLLGRPKVDISELCCEDLKWTSLGQDPLQWRIFVLAVCFFGSQQEDVGLVGGIVSRSINS